MGNIPDWNKLEVAFDILTRILCPRLKNISLFLCFVSFEPQYACLNTGLHGLSDWRWRSWTVTRRLHQSINDRLEVNRREFSVFPLSLNSGVVQTPLAQTNLHVWRLRCRLKATCYLFTFQNNLRDRKTQRKRGKQRQSGQQEHLSASNTKRHLFKIRTVQQHGSSAASLIFNSLIIMSEIKAGISRVWSCEMSAKCQLLF